MGCLTNEELEKYSAVRKLLRNPPVESVDIYPGLVVWDNRVGGSITVRKSRLPLWTLIGTALRENWAAVQDGWNVDDYDYTSEELAEFLYHLLDVRGEFSRLLLEIANAQRETDHWYSDKSLTKRVSDQLRRCADSLEKE